MWFDAIQGCPGKAHNTKFLRQSEQHIQVEIIFISIAVAFFPMQHWPDFGGNALGDLTSLCWLDGLLVYRASNDRQVIDYGVFTSMYRPGWSRDGHKFVALFERLLHRGGLFESFVGVGGHKKHPSLGCKCIKGEGIFLKGTESDIERVIVIACMFAHSLHGYPSPPLAEPFEDVSLRG